ncbi:MAG TPA: TetR/AcrR family transcriptional regulator [Candidatus Dormibacteraeota bacterium]
MTDLSRARDLDARRARAERILDTAGALLLRWGYDRVTMEDVASQSGVGKGTVYLHWRTREELFVAVLLREGVAAIEELLAALRQDPEEALLDRLTHRLYLGIMRRPLSRAIFTADLEVLGKLARLSDTPLLAQTTEQTKDYLRLLQEHGLVRGDLTVDELFYAYDATLNGFFLSESSPQYGELPIERRAELVAGIVRRALGAEPPAPEVVTTVAARVIEIFGRMADSTLAHLRQGHEERR